MYKEIAKPFLKWAGGKGQLLKQFEELYPQELIEGQIETYIEPFVGGGAVYFSLDCDAYYINDKSTELIALYQMIASQNEDFFQHKDLDEQTN